jgi:hypothetical protein
VKAKLDTDPITTPTKASLAWLNKRLFNHVIRDLRLTPIDIKVEDFHMSTKSGPNGQALLTSMHDFTLLPECLRHNIIAFGGDKLKYTFEGIQEPIQKGWTLVDLFKH